jgi:phosphatidylinositol glycan class M
MDKPYLWALLIIPRLAFLIFGLLTDHYAKEAGSTVTFTDIDFFVLADGAAAAYDGGSPFHRHTYRYSPLYVIPHCFFAFVSGGTVYDLFAHVGTKLVWLTADAATALITLACLPYAGVALPPWLPAATLSNILAIQIASRGSPESLITVLTMATVWLVVRCRWSRGLRAIAAGVALGLAIHLKLYPVLYVPIVGAALALGERPEDIDSEESLFGRLRHRLSLHSLSLGLLLVGSTALSALAFTYAASAAIAHDPLYIEEAFLYHVTRRDHRHNFSVYFYQLYLESSHHASASSLLPFLPQLFTQLALLLRFGGNMRAVPLHMFASTVTFVALNKVCTVQYFVWYLIFIPLLVPILLPNPSPSLSLSPNNGVSKTRLSLYLSLFVVSMASWLSAAFFLEHQGKDTFLLVFSSSLLFFLVQFFIVLDILVRADV